MNAQLLLTAFSKIGDDPDRIQQLRKIAVALAVSGKLDNGAASMTPSQVLEAVNRVKANLAKRGAISEPKRMEEVAAEELPADFSGPARFAPLGELARIEKGLTGIQQAQPGDYPLVVTSAERSTCDHFDFNGAAAIIPLVSSTGHGNASINRLHFQEGKFALGTILVAAFPYDPALIFARFLFEYLSAFKEELLVSRMTGTANVTLSVGRVAEVPVPLICPDAQRKVDELMALCDQLEQARAGREAVRDRLTTASLARLTATDTDAETFQSHARFALQSPATLTTRPDQIKTLRQAILNLAVRGRLVEQDDADEPATELLARLIELRSQLIAKKALRKSRDLQSINAEEISWKLPIGWIFSRLGVVFDVRDGTHDKTKYVDNGFPLITSKNLSSGSLSFDGVKLISKSDHLQISDRSKVERNDILLAMIGSVGNPVIVDSDLEFSIKNVALFKYLDHSQSCPNFLRYFLIYAADEMKRLASGGLQPFVSLGFLRNYPFPLPPLAEQHRIVARVDTLMALCDQLEASLTTTANIRRTLLEALLQEALEPVAELETIA